MCIYIYIYVYVGRHNITDTCTSDPETLMGVRRFRAVDGHETTADDEDDLSRWPAVHSSCTCLSTLAGALFVKQAKHNLGIRILNKSYLDMLMKKDLELSKLPGFLTNKAPTDIYTLKSV